MGYGFFHILGLDDASGPWYLLWSGVGANLTPNLTMLAGLTIWYRRHNCHESRCHRIGRFHVDDTPMVVCKRHHPHFNPETGQEA